MNLYKYLFLVFAILVLLAATVLINSGCMSKQAENPSAEPTESIGAEYPSAELSEYIDRNRHGKLDELSLKIYYLNPYILTNIPVSEKDLMEKSFEYKVTISGKGLYEHIDLLDQLAKAPLIPAEQESGVDARLYYVFETKENRKIFSVCMWGRGDKFIVNGLRVEENEIFYDVVMPFLPEDAAEELQTYLKRNRNP